MTLSAQRNLFSSVYLFGKYKQNQWGCSCLVKVFQSDPVDDSGCFQHWSFYRLPVVSEWQSQEYKVPFVPPAIHILNVSAGSILLGPADCSQLRMLLPAWGLSRLLHVFRLHLLHCQLTLVIVSLCVKCSVVDAAHLHVRCLFSVWLICR